MKKELKDLKKGSVLVTLEPDILREIDQRLYSLPLHNMNRTYFVRRCIYEALGHDMPESPNQLPDREQMSSLPLDHLPKDTARVVQLYCEGGSLSSVCRQMIQEGWKTRRGGLWYHNSVKQLLFEAIQKCGLAGEMSA